MENPKLLNTENVSQFGFAATFDLHLNKILIDITGMTDFHSGGAALVQAISFRVQDPTGLIIAEELLEDGHQTVEIPISALFAFGFYTIEGTLVEEDGLSYTASLTKNICEPAGWNGKAVKGKFDIQVDCQVPKAVITETTPFVYLGKTAVSIQKDGRLFYPDRLVGELDFTQTPFSIGAVDGLYTGTYIIRNLTLAKFDLGDGAFVKVPYSTSQEFKVECGNALEDILCCVTDLEIIADKYANSAKGKNAQEKINSASPYILLALLKEKSGKNAAKEVDKIKSILNCDCGCGDSSGSRSLEPRLIAGNGGGGSNTVVTGSGAAVVSPGTSGDTVTYNVKVKAVSLNKSLPTDQAISIVKTTNDTSISYAIGFDYEVLTKTVLQTINGNAELKELLNSMVEQATTLDVSSVNGKCVVDLEEKTVQAFFQAIIDYLCDLSALQVSLGQALSLNTFNSQNALVATQFTSTAKVMDYLAAVNTLLNVLSARVTATFTLTCTAVKGVFNTTVNPFIETDKIYGTKGGDCAAISHKDFVKQFIATVAADAELKALFCAVVNTCSVEIVDLPMNVTATLLDDCTTFTSSTVILD